MNCLQAVGSQAYIACICVALLLNLRLFLWWKPISDVPTCPSVAECSDGSDVCNFSLLSLWVVQRHNCSYILQTNHFFLNFDLSFTTLQSEHEDTFDSQMRMCLGTWEVCLTVQLTTLALRCAKLYNKCQNFWSKLAIDLPCQRIVLNCMCMQTDRSAALTSPLVGHASLRYAFVLWIRV
jgi:hypothetical protein